MTEHTLKKLLEQTRPDVKAPQRFEKKVSAHIARLELVKKLIQLYVVAPTYGIRESVNKRKEVEN